jgi:ankyrin repeat protein
MKYGKSPELLTLLLKNGADPNAKWGNLPPLYCSFLYNFKEERIRQLFTAGADPDQKFGNNFTALHGCVKKHNAVKLLIEFKANLNVVSKYGQTPLDLALKYGNPQTVKLLRDNGAKKASEL